MLKYNKYILNSNFKHKINFCWYIKNIIQSFIVINFIILFSSIKLLGNNHFNLIVLGHFLKFS